jgi:hypothetical protein
MKNVKPFVKKSWVLLLSLAIIGASAVVMNTGIVTAHAAQENTVSKVPTQMSAVSTEHGQTTMVSATQRVFAIVDVKPANTSGMDAKKAAEVNKVYTPSDKDITKEQAADKIAAKIVELTNSDLRAYNAAMQLLPIKERDTWFGTFTSPEGKTTYLCKIDAVTGAVWYINMFVRSGGENSEKAGGGVCDSSKTLLSDSQAVFGYTLDDPNTQG